MKQRSVGKDAFEMTRRQCEREKILLPHFTAAKGSGHLRKVGGTLDANCDVTEIGEGLEIASRPAAEIENPKRGLTLDVLEQRRDVLADIMIARALPERIGTLVV